MVVGPKMRLWTAKLEAQRQELRQRALQNSQRRVEKRVSNGIPLIVLSSLTGIKSSVRNCVLSGYAVLILSMGFPISAKGREPKACAVTFLEGMRIARKYMRVPARVPSCAAHPRTLHSDELYRVWSSCYALK